MLSIFCLSATLLTANGVAAGRKGQYTCTEVYTGDKRPD